MQSKPEDVLVNTEQQVNVSWEDPAVPDQITQQVFTYKPDPVIEDIHPNVTIPRYAIRRLYRIW